MQPIAAPLKPGDQGASVANLQDALLLLIDTNGIQLGDADRQSFKNALTQEQSAQVYKGATTKAVAIFQQQHQLTQSGAVDDGTAAALNAILRKLGAFTTNQQDLQQGVVAGQVLQSDQTPFAGAVTLAYKNAAGLIRLGEDSTDPEGRYAITYTLPADAAGVDLRVAAFDDAGQLRAEATSEAAESVEVVNLAVQDAGKAFRVMGTVTSDTRAGVGGLRVVIVDKNVGSDTTVAETTTNVDGSYRAVFSYTGQKQQPDLQARALSGQILLGVSEVRYNAANDETLHVAVTGDAETTLATEHEVLTGDLAAHFAGNLRDLKETDDQQDVTYLANKTGWDARAVALASLADQFSASTTNANGAAGIPAPLFYALFRAGLPANNAALFRTDSATVAAVWKQGIAQGIIPAQLEASIPAALTQFQTLSVRQALDGPAISGLSSLGQMLAVSLPNADTIQREQFATLQLQHQGDPAAFWNAVQTTFGAATTQRLRLDGQLGFLTLNNAPLAAKIHAAAGQTPLADPVDLVAQGFHQSDKWLALIGNDAVPPEIAGADDQERRANYADVLATQLRLSYPTATVAAMVKSGETPTADGTADKVQSFLLQHQDRFTIGMQPVAQFAARNQVQLEPDVQREITRIQRVQQITPSDAAMNALLKGGVDSASAVVRYDRAEFVGAFKDTVGGAASAALIYAKAQQVHTAVLNIATSYMLASNAPPIGMQTARIVTPAPHVPANAGDVIAYPTLEGLFGAQDFCDCEACRSILSPAAYLVDLLQFVDRDHVRWAAFLSQWKQGHGSAPYPFGDQAAWNAAGQPTDTEITPLDVLLSRRPDLQHLPLTCENTNTPLPYIDLVNETLEYYVANGLKLADYTGHTTDDSATPEELMANPQFVQDAAYDILAGTSNLLPLPPTVLLPFHQPLEQLRRFFDAFAAPLPQVMEALRTSDAVERASANDYGWRDIWMEELHLSRAEYTRLSDRTLTLQQLYGFSAATTDADVLAALSNATAFTQRFEISYADLLDLLRTRFINPNGLLIPKWQRLGMPLATLKAFKEGTISDQQFDDALAPQLDPAQYGGDIKAWVKNQANFDAIMSLLVLADPTGANTGDFGALAFRYADPARLVDQVRPFEFVRLLRFIRLWKKLGWSIVQTDQAIAALYPADQLPNDADDTVNLERLDVGFLILLPRLSVLKRLLDSLNLNVKKDLLPLLVCFAPIDTYGSAALYRTLFLSPALLKQDPVFADDGFGNVLGGSAKLLDHGEALRAALTLTSDEFRRISGALGFDATTPLTVDTVSAIFRRGWLARTLKLSVQEFLLLVQFSGLDPFTALDPADPPILRFIALVTRLRAAGLKPTQALYLIWNQDISGISAPKETQINEFVRSLRASFAAVESDFAVVDDPDGQIARARMALVYDNATTDLFFGLLNNTLISDVAYSHNQSTLAQEVLDAALGRISYDDFRKRLAFVGVMTSAVRDALKAVPGVSSTFTTAIDNLYAANQSVVTPFFTRYPELQPLYDAYVTANMPLETKRAALLANFLPTLKQRRKRLQAVQAISAAAKTDTTFAEAILDNNAVLHAATDATRPALDDLAAVEEGGLSVQFFFRNTATAPVDLAQDAEPMLAYTSADTTKLPGNNGNPISGIWSGYLEAPTSDFYNIRIEADPGSRVTLAVDGTDVTLAQDSSMWHNAAPLELRAGTLYAVSLTVEQVQNTLRVQWQTTGRGWEVIPSRYLYSATRRDVLRQTYVRFFKIVSLASVLKVTANEMAYLAASGDGQINGQGWLNSLPVTDSPNAAMSAALSTVLTMLLDFVRLKAALAPDDERLLAVLQDPQAAIQQPDGLLFVLTRWDPSSLAALLNRFGKTNADLMHLDTLRRVFDAFQWVTALGISATALIAATTNEPSPTTVRDLQAALRARYTASDWLNVIKPISDQMRSLQRDALVAYILHQMRTNSASAQIDTSDKLFEYFLMDVQMEPCMQTSRIRHALSSVQLFIERCLMNLEPRVAASALAAQQWEWMKRYRVWEANRKVFLWPENWLEPELRDDQSPFFKETISELLQSDITEDRAATALLNYLSKLEEVAKLEPCSIHYVENDPGSADDIAHVVARTAGAHRKYYYRRHEHGSWTPWEQIKLDIEDNPVILVVWKDRLLLFWLRIVKQAATMAQKPFTSDGNLVNLKTTDLKTAPPQLTVQALLCWSEYYNGTWQPTKTSDVNKPTDLGQFNAAGFDRAEVQLSVREEGDALRVVIGGPGASSFLLYNTHSLPVRREDAPVKPIVFGGPQRFLDVVDNHLTASYSRGGIIFGIVFSPSTVLLRPVLTHPLAAATIAPAHALASPWDAPFFYEDSRHVFYVTTGEQPVLVRQFQGFGDIVNSATQGFTIPPLVLQPQPMIPDHIGPMRIDQSNGLSNPASIKHFMSEDAYIKQALGTSGTVHFGDKELGPSGAITTQR